MEEVLAPLMAIGMMLGPILAIFLALSPLLIYNHLSKQTKYLKKLVDFKEAEIKARKLILNAESGKK